MLEHLRRRAPVIEAHQGLIEDLDLGRRFDLVIGPSSILTSTANLAAAVRQVGPGGRIGMELMNPRWLRTRHSGVRVKRRPNGSSALEVDYRLPDGSTAVQVVDGWRPGPTPEAMRRRLKRLGLEVLWPGSTLADSPTYYVIAGQFLPIHGEVALPHLWGSTRRRRGMGLAS
jgi:hypothetical protein